MIKLPKKISATDIRQWLSRGWFYYKDNEGNYLVCTSRMWPENERDGMIVDSVDGVQYNVSRPFTKKLFPHWPECGAINLPKHGIATFVERRQRRQYRRTYNSGCVSLSTPRSWDLTKLDIPVQAMNGDSREVVKSCFNPEYYSYPELPALFAKGWYSIAISPQIIIFNNPGEDWLMYYKGSLAGSIDKNNVFDPVDYSMIKRVARHLDDYVTIM